MEKPPEEREQASPSLLSRPQLVSAPETVSFVEADVAVNDVPDSVADGVETLMMMKNSENFINTQNISNNINISNISKPPVVEEPFTGKRKRGRPPRNQAAARPVPPRKIKEDEDVCFICFDGGTLVLCDHRSCPKAYHPACIKRDEAFFQSKAKWDCGWHLCNNCQRAAYYMCYTCTYSLCKGCTKGADFSTVRGSKGFCGTCMKTIMLIENGAQPNGEVVQVDFDDKTSWEYLFKVYWVCLKEQLSLTVHDLTRAKNPFREAAVLASNIESRVDLRYGNDGKGCGSDIFRANIETDLANRKVNDQQKDFNKAYCPSIGTSGNDSAIPLPGGAKWATKELLEFVAHMKNGDTSMLSHFDLQALLLEYIKRKNLRDPLQECEIICDSRLTNLLGKARVGHIEMIKLLDYHIFTNITPPPVETIKRGVVDVVASQVQTNGSTNNQLMMENDRKRKTRSTKEKAPPANLAEYAAINVHNVNLIYLTRKLMENMIDDDIDKFREKATGSIVRIKIFDGDQKHEAYRLVQVLGTSKASEPYNIGSRTTDVLLEVLNLDKKELVSVVDLSNQEFSEDECIRLRQSIKCGLNKRLKVGEIKEKAMALKALKVDEWLEAEILCLSHLRDQASEKGHKKEQKECVEKLQLLSPEGRQAKLLEIPEVHADPNMDPAYDSDDNAGFVYDKKKDVNKRRKTSGVGRRKVISVSSPRGVENACTTFHADKAGIVHTPGSIASSSREAVMIQTFISDTDADHIWNYRDPMGKIQGPFPMSQMRKWSVHFPADLKIWRITESPDDSILLTHALQRNVVQLQPQEVRTVTDDKNRTLNVKSCRSLNVTDAKIEQATNVSTTRSDGNNGIIVNTGLGPHSSGVTTTDTSARVVATTDASKQEDVEKKTVRSAGLGSHPSGVTTPSENDAHINSIDDVVNEIIRSVGLGSHSSAVTQSDDASIHGTDNSKLARADGLDSHSSRVTQNDAHIHSNKFARGDGLGSRFSGVTTTDASTRADAVNEIIRSVGLGSLSSKPTQIDTSINGTNNSKLATHGNVNDRLVRSDRLSTHSSSSADVADSKGLTQNAPVGWGYLPTQPQVDSSIPSSTFSVKSSETPKFQVGEVIQDLAKTSDSQKRPDCNVPADQSPGENEIIVGSLTGPDFNTMVSPVPKSLEILAKNGSIDFLNLGGSTPKSGNEESRVKISMSSDIPLQDSGPSWNTASNLVPGGTQLREVAGEWHGYSTAPAKNVKEWDLNISQKPVGMVDQLTHASPSCPAPPSWQAMVNDPADFAALVDESVSDLLAEVEAMESLNGVSSATSGMRPPDDEDDCFSPLDGFSPAHGPGKIDESRSTGDFHAPSHLTESFRISQGDFLYPQKHSSVRSQHLSADAEYNTKPSGIVSVNRHEMGSHVPSSSGVDMATADLLWRLEPQNREAHWASIHSNVNLRSGGGLSLASAVADIDWGSTQTTAPMNPSLSMSMSTTMSTPYENPRILHDQPRYGGDNRISGQRDSDFGDNRISGQRDRDSGDNRFPVQRDGDFGDNRISGQRDSRDSRISGQRDGDFGDNRISGQKDSRDNRILGQRDGDFGDNRISGQRDSRDNRFPGQIRDGDSVDNRISGQRDSRENRVSGQQILGTSGRDSDFSRGSRSSSFNHRQQPMNGNSTHVGGHYRTDRQQLAYGGITNGGGSYYRQQPPKGQRVCKFYGSGHCKRGASCNYWHPHP